MKKWAAFVCFLAVGHLIGEEVTLSNLIAYDKAVCLERLEKASTEELWDAFLVGQANLNFTTEFHWISNEKWWQKATSVLDIGCGNGTYLSKVAEQFSEKRFLGIEKLPSSVKLANERYAKNGVMFEEGDAEVFHESLTGSTDVILFRLVLQHLQKPLLALQNSWHYLTSNGYVLIIDSYDPAKRTSHPISEIDHLLELVAEKQANSDKGHRKISLTVLQQIENQQSPLNELYRVVFTNLDVNGNVVNENIRLVGEERRKQFFNHNLLFMTLVHRTFQVPVDLSKGYDELIDYLADENAWSVIGMHCLVLQKKESNFQ